MTLRVSRRGVRGILWWTESVLFVFAVSMLAYCAFVVTETWFFQKDQDRRLEKLLAGRRASGGMALHAAFPMPALPVAGALIGRMEIPRLGLSAIVVEGTSDRVLRHALGHISGTALPGLAGNTGISGHRDTFFRPLRNILPNDVITLTTLQGEFRYRVVSTRIVEPADVAVLDSSGAQILTLVTCYPFYFVGPAPRRFVVRAERETSERSL